MNKKAILKSTGEEVEITSSFFIKEMNLSLSFDDGFSINESYTTSTYIFDTGFNSEGSYHILSNGKEVSDDEVIIGKTNIRDYKIDKINGV